MSSEQTYSFDDDSALLKHARLAMSNSDDPFEDYSPNDIKDEIEKAVDAFLTIVVSPENVER